MSEPTPTPWRTTPDNEWTADTRITSDACRHIAKVYGPEPGVQSPNADFIVRAANAHAALVEALKNARLGLDPFFHPTELLAQVDAALALASEDAP